MTTPDTPTLLSQIEPVAWRYRGPKGGWITVETMPPHSYVGVQALYPEAALTRLQSALEARTEADYWRGVEAAASHLDDVNAARGKRSNDYIAASAAAIRSFAIRKLQEQS